MKESVEGDWVQEHSETQGPGACFNKVREKNWLSTCGLLCLFSLWMDKDNNTMFFFNPA